MAGLTTADTPMGDAPVSTCGVPNSLNNANLLPLPVDATSLPMMGRDCQPYTSMGLPLNMASQLPHTTAPLTHGFDADNSGTDVRTAADFTKQSNWVQKVVEDLRDFLQVISCDGKLLYVSPSCKSLTGYEYDHLVGRSVFDFVHDNDRTMFSREFNDSISTGNDTRFYYRFKNQDGAYLMLEAHGHPHLPTETMSSEPAKGVITPPAFFMMARPYPNKNAQLLDLFLEHKVENERLLKKIADLKKEEEEESEALQQWLQRKDSHENITANHSIPKEDNLKIHLATTPDFGTMLPPRKPGGQSNSEDATTTPLSDSTPDKISRFESTSYIDGIELMTGLRYREGERSHGLSTGDPRGALIRSAASISFPPERDYRTSGPGDRKKKFKVAEEYVCTDCGTMASPEWRKGPHGPKTLCNACGCKSTLPPITFYCYPKNPTFIRLPAIKEALPKLIISPTNSTLGQKREKTSRINLLHYRCPYHRHPVDWGPRAAATVCKLIPITRLRRPAHTTLGLLKLIFLACILITPITKPRFNNSLPCFLSNIVQHEKSASSSLFFYLGVFSIRFSFYQFPFLLLFFFPRPEG